MRDAVPEILRRLIGFRESDLWLRFASSPMAVAAALVALLCVGGAMFASVLAPHQPFDLATLELADSRLPRQPVAPSALRP